MKLLVPLIFLAVTLGQEVIGTLPPKWILANFDKKCLGSQPSDPNGSTFNVVCLPRDPPEGCSEDKWKEWTTKYQQFDDDEAESWPSLCRSGY